MRTLELLQTHSLLYENATLLQVVGELDMATAPLVDQAVAACLAEQPQHVYLDLSRLEFCDRTGLGALLRARHRARAQGAMVHLISIHRQLRRSLAALGGTDLLAPSPA
ncbi:STAS domain-containing protein [Streptomyces mirabilis]|uniref:STAS domain-containing protein n=1 Tax=Streptomyces mirabilis TaxID=68239 RepID=UPI003693E1FD